MELSNHLTGSISRSYSERKVEGLVFEQGSGDLICNYF